MPTVVSRRIHDACAHYFRGDYERCLIDLFPALDKTAKKNFPDARVGSRIRSFIDHHEMLIWWLADTVLLRQTKLNGLTLSEAIYKYGRTSIAHEGELDEKLKFDAPVAGGIRGPSPDGVWHLHGNFIFALIISVVISPVNAAEKIDANCTVRIAGERFDLNYLWGKECFVEDLIRKVVNDRDLAFR